MKKYLKNYYKRKGGICTVILLLVVSMLLCGMTQTVSADEQEASDKRVIRIGYLGYKGFITQDGERNYTGYGVEFLSEIADYTGWKYEYIYNDFETHLDNLRNGRIDFLIELQKTPEREAEFLYSQNIIGVESSVLYVRSDENRYYYNDYEAFDGMRIACVVGSFQGQQLEEVAKQKDFSYELYEYDTPNGCFSALERKQVDAVAIGSNALNEKYKIVSRFGSAGFYAVTGAYNAELMEEMNTAIEQVYSVKPNYRDYLSEKYYGRAGNQEVVFTREEAAYIAEEKEITVAFIPNRKPYSYINENGEIDGITVDLVKEIQEKSGLRFNYVMMEVGETPIDYMKEHPEHIVAGVSASNPQFLNNNYQLSEVICSDNVAIVSRPGTEYKVVTGSEHYKLVIPKSFGALRSYIQAEYPEFDIILADSTEECLAMVHHKEADFMAQNINVLSPYLQKPIYEDYTVLSNFFMEEEMALVTLNINDQNVGMNIIDKCIATITERERAQYVVNHTLKNTYELTLSDILYKSRTEVAIIVFLIVLVFSMMIGGMLIRSRHYALIKSKNIELAEAVAQANSAN